ncbi:MAG: hypothetical protein ACFFDP_02195 [Promethearchaeota archaeon]
MEKKYKLMIGGFIVAASFVAIGVFVLGFANETLDMIASMFGVPEWEIWFPPFPDYEIPGYEGNLITNFIIGITFTLLILVLTFGIMWAVTRFRAKE